ncbi:MAG TPA: hypothetical protein VII20_23685, partial [Roseiarcus sp.]
RDTASFIDCMKAIMRERNSNSTTALRAAARGGDGFAVVLDFEFLSRSAPPCKQWGNLLSSLRAIVLEPLVRQLVYI